LHSSASAPSPNRARSKRTTIQTDILPTQQHSRSRMDIPANTDPSVSAPDILWSNGRFGQTSRRDNWWASPLLVFLGFGIFLIYANWAAFQNRYYTFGPYIS